MKRKFNKEKILLLSVLLIMLLIPYSVSAAGKQIDLGKFDVFSKTYKNATGGASTYKGLVVGYSYKTGNETMILPTVSGFNYQDAISTDDYSYIVNFDGDKTAKNIAEKYISKIQFLNTSSNTELYIILTESTIQNKTIYYSPNKHFYQYVPFNGEAKSWTTSYEEARNTYFAGRQGYLATITSNEENDFIYSASNSVGWLGGTILVPGNKNGNYYDSFVTTWSSEEEVDGGTAPSSANELAEKWYWANGPEVGKTFYDRRFVEDEGDGIRDYDFDAWYDGTSTEPNNPFNEQCLATVKATENFTWNNIVWNRNDTKVRWMPIGYFIEFGDEIIGDSSDSTGGDECIFKKFDKGTINVIEPETPNEYKFKIAETEDELIPKIDFTSEDLDILESGKNIDIYLEVKDISDIISLDEKEKFEDKLETNDTVGMYLDVSLYKRIEGDSPTKIDKTKKAVKISFEMPKELINNDPIISRTYKLLKLYNGTVTEINVELNGNIATFETDEFSTYALVYTDAKVISNPKTGDNIMSLIIMLIISGLGLSCILSYVIINNKKKISNKIN